jgi:hypothetical protein
VAPGWKLGARSGAGAAGFPARTRQRMTTAATDATAMEAANRAPDLPQYAERWGEVPGEQIPAGSAMGGRQEAGESHSHGGDGGKGGRGGGDALGGASPAGHHWAVPVLHASSMRVQRSPVTPLQEATALSCSSISPATSSPLPGSATVGGHGSWPANVFRCKMIASTTIRTASSTLSCAPARCTPSISLDLLLWLS